MPGFLPSAGRLIAIFYRQARWDLADQCVQTQKKAKGPASKYDHCSLVLHIISFFFFAGFLHVRCRIPTY